MCALRGAALLVVALLTPGWAIAQPAGATRAELLDAGYSNAIGWWSRPGLPGWTPDADFGVAFPPTLAGLVRGAWRSEDPHRPLGASPAPGLFESGVTLAWLDTLSLALASSGAWDGFDSGLAVVRGETWETTRTTDHPPRALADVLLGSGSNGYQDNALSLRTGDPTSFFWGEVESMNREELGALDLAGRHAYDGVASRTIGRHRVSGGFAQRGSAASLQFGIDEAASGESGQFEYEYRPERYQLRARLARDHDARESFGAGLPYSRRDAQQDDVDLELVRHDEVEHWAVRVHATRAEVQRAEAGTTVGGTASSVWTAARWQRAAGEGAWVAELGAGHHDGVDRFEWAPSLSYRFGAHLFAGRAVIEREIVPVWSDLAVSQARFVQSTWLGGLELVSSAARAHGQLGFYAGRTRDRAVVARLPLTDLWLRAGFSADPGDYDFALVTGDAQWSVGPVVLGGAGFALARDESSLQPRVDPSQGFRASAEWGFLAFQKDLGVRLRGEAVGIGTREMQSGPTLVLPGYVSYGASAALVLADVKVTLRAFNLEDRIRPQVWVDPATGEAALGTGREFQIALTWRLLN